MNRIRSADSRRLRWPVYLVSVALLLFTVIIFAALSFYANLIAIPAAPMDPTGDFCGNDINVWGWLPDGNGPAIIRSSSADLVYELRPNAVSNTPFATNSFGFRDHEFSLDKPPGIFRIIVLGDSLTFGWWEQIDETYPKVLERLLNENPLRPLKFEVYNLGIGGYNSTQELALLRTRALRFRPDLVIVGFCLNDYFVASDAGQWRHFRQDRSWWANTAAIQVKFYSFVLGEILGYPTVLRDYVKMRDLLNPHQIPLLIVLFPVQEDPLFGAGARMASALRRTEGIEMLELRETYDAAGWSGLMHEDGYHPTVKGHLLAAEAIYAYLQANSALLSRQSGHTTNASNIPTE